MPIFDKIVIFLKNCWSDRSETLHVGAQGISAKMKFEKGGTRKFWFFRKMEKITFHLLYYDRNLIVYAVKVC